MTSADRSHDATGSRGIDVALAEYEALRQEIVATRQIQASFIGLGLTAIGLIITFALGTDGDRGLLLAIPAVAFAVELLLLGASYRVYLLGRYIGLELWPFLMTHTSYSHSWESTRPSDRRVSTRSPVAAALLADVSVLLLLVGSSVAAMVLYGKGDRWSIGGWILIVATLLSAAGVATAISSGHRDAPANAPQSATP